MSFHTLMTFLNDNGIIVNVIMIRLLMCFLAVISGSIVYKFHTVTSFTPIGRYFTSVIINTALSYVAIEFIPRIKNIWLLAPFIAGLTIDVLPNIALTTLNNPDRLKAMLKAAFDYGIGTLPFLGGKKKEDVEKFKKGYIEMNNLERLIPPKEKDEEKKEVKEKGEVIKEREVDDDLEEVNTTDGDTQETEEENETDQIEERLKRKHRFRRH